MSIYLKLGWLALPLARGIRRLLAAFFFDGRIKLSQGQMDMLKREWAFLFG